jgi:hypothetical protein
MTQCPDRSHHPSLLQSSSCPAFGRRNLVKQSALNKWEATQHATEWRAIFGVYQMKESPADFFRKHAQQYRPASKKKNRKERSDRRWQSIKEGWDVSGPRWRIGWGGLDETQHGVSHSERRH